MGLIFFFLKEEPGIRKWESYATFMDGHVHPAEAFLLEAVHVLSEGIASLLRSLQERPVQLMVGPAPRHAQRAFTASVPAGAELVALRLAEVGQAVCIVPPCGAFPVPAVVVFSVPAYIDHGIERRGASPHPAARPVQHTAVQACLWLCVVVPVVPAVAQVGHEGCGHVDRPQEPLASCTCVLGPSLQQQHMFISVLCEPPGQHTARGACTHDHVTVFIPTPGGLTSHSTDAWGRPLTPQGSPWAQVPSPPASQDAPHASRPNPHIHGRKCDDLLFLKQKRGLKFFKLSMHMQNHPKAGAATLVQQRSPAGSPSGRPRAGWGRPGWYVPALSI